MPNTEHNPRDLAELAARRRAREIDPFHNALECLRAECKKEDIHAWTKTNGERIIEVNSDQGWHVVYRDDDYIETFEPLP